jgi:hypothetical protein
VVPEKHPQVYSAGMASLARIIIGAVARFVGYGRVAV